MIISQMVQLHGTSGQDTDIQERITKDPGFLNIRIVKEITILHYKRRINGERG